MNLRVALDGCSVDLELRRSEDAFSFRARSDRGDSGDRTASLIEVEPGIYSVLLDGRSYEVRVEPGQQGVFVSLNGRRFAVEVSDPRRLRRKPAGLAGVGAASVSAAMPGRVVRLLAAEGDVVEAGQGLVVVEAMKMQNEMKSPKRGRVAELRVREGEAVGAGAVLAIIE